MAAVAIAAFGGSLGGCAANVAAEADVEAEADTEAEAEVDAVVVVAAAAAATAAAAMLVAVTATAAAAACSPLASRRSALLPALCLLFLRSSLLLINDAAAD